MRSTSGRDVISLGINKNMGGNVRINQKNGSRSLVLESDKIAMDNFYAIITAIKRRFLLEQAV